MSGLTGTSTKEQLAGLQAGIPVGDYSRIEQTLASGSVLNGVLQDAGGAVYNIKNPAYGLVGDVRQVTDGAITIGTPNYQSATAAFTQADTLNGGKWITVAGAGAAPQPLVARILSVQSPTQATLSANAIATVSGAATNIGTGNSAALQALVNLIAAAGGGTIFAPPDAASSGFGLETLINWASYVNLMGSGWSSTFYELNANSTILEMNAVVGVIVSRMRFSGTGGPGVPGRGAIHGVSTGTFGLSKCMLLNNYLDTVGSCGIACDTCTETTIAGNIVIASKEHGIYTSDNFNDGSVIGNIVLNAGLNNGTANPIQGINVENTNRVTYSANVIEAPKNNGLYVGSRTPGPQHCTFTANTIRDCPDWAFRISFLSFCTISGNVIIATGAGTQAAIGYAGVGGAPAVVGLTLTGNIINQGQSPAFQGNAAVTSSRMLMKGNMLVGNTAGATIYQIDVISTNDLIEGNFLSSGVGNGIRANTGSVGVRIINNFVNLAGTKYSDLGTNTIIVDWSAPAGVAAIVVTASPFTYTAGATMEAVYISGGTVSVVAKNGITIFAASPCTVLLDPHEAVTVTYTVAPTMNKDRK